ncbi:MAG: c-type cytochrome [Rhodospirillales bacterium]
MRIFIPAACLAVIAAVLAYPTVAAADGDAARGKRDFLKCAVCHSANPNTHKTGPSLAGVWGRKAGTVEGFSRYSDALQNSGVTWNDHTLDAWLQEPRKFIPGTTMTLAPIRDSAERRNIIAYLKQLASDSPGKAAGGQESAPGGGMMGMMGSSELADVSKPPPAQQVTSIRYCRDTYQVTTADGKTLKFWEFNLRFKTDSTANGPPNGKPVLLPAGMMGGDRSFVVFRGPREISGFIEEKC